MKVLSKKSFPPHPVPYAPPPLSLLVISFVFFAEYTYANIRKNKCMFSPLIFGLQNGMICCSVHVSEYLGALSGKRMQHCLESQCPLVAV